MSFPHCIDHYFWTILCRVGLHRKGEDPWVAQPCPFCASEREISERASPNCWIQLQQRHIEKNVFFCGGHTAAFMCFASLCDVGESPLLSWTSARSEGQSLVAQPWSAKSHQDRFRAEILFLGCWFYSIYMFWQEVLLKTTWGGGLSCWNNFCILCMVEIPSWTYSKFFESCCCLYFTSRFDFAPGHDLESARVQHEAQILQELGSRGISKCPDSPDLLV